ncbi:MAG: hypothetical protein IPO08_24370 [Xanthomonadales bacterium]|nr:hypothetical protein [Xanthomonadales bacterium]
MRTAMAPDDQTGEYAGVGAMNTSLISRFLKSRSTHPTEAEETKAVIASVAETDPEIIAKVVQRPRLPVMPPKTAPALPAPCRREK